jgi:hypothetical protein
MFQYIHNVNAKVEQGRRYLTDVVKLALETEDILDVDGITVIGEQHRVTVHPAVANGVETITTVPVHPKTVGETKEVPTYAVPSTLKVLVRADVEDIAHETAGENQRNWVEATVDVHPIVDSVFADHVKALAFYEELAHQLAQGDDIRNYQGQDALRDQYSNANSRYHG